MRDQSDPDHESVVIKKRVKVRTLISFLFGIIALLCAVVIQSHKRLCCSASQRNVNLWSDFLPLSWEGIFNDLLRHDILFHIFRSRYSTMNSSEKKLYDADLHVDNGVTQKVLTRHHFDFVLIGDGEQIQRKYQNAFSWVSAQIINDLQVLHEAAIMEIVVARREISLPLRLILYSRSAMRRSATSGANGENSSSNNETTRSGKIHYLVDNDFRLGKVPIRDILGDITDGSSECASDPGCSVIQMVFYVPPEVKQPFLFATSLPSLLNSVAIVDAWKSQYDCNSHDSPSISCAASEYMPASGITVDGKASIVVVNAGVPDEQSVRSILALARSHVRHLIGLPPSSIKSSLADHGNGGITLDDVLILRAERLRPLYTSALVQLTAFRELRGGGSSTQIRLNVDRRSIENYQEAVEELLTCREMVHDTVSDSLSDSDTVTRRGDGASNSDDSVNIKTAQLTQAVAHAHCLRALQLSNDLSVDPRLQSPPYFPLDQQLALYSPFWVPILIPLSKGLCTRVLLPLLGKWRRGGWKE